MALRPRHSLAIALVLGCTTSNPAFEAGTESRGGTEDDGEASEGSPETGSDDADSASSEDSGADDVVEETGSDESSEGSDTDPTGGTCSAEQPMKIGEATSLDARQCPSKGFIRGHVFALNDGSFEIMDCGDCSLCPEGAPTWTVIVPAPLAAETLVEDECIDVFYDCDDPGHTELRNIAVMRGSMPTFVIGGPALPQAIWAWEPAPQDGAPCPTESCAENTEMRLQFVDGNLGEGENGRRSIFVYENDFELEILVRNAHYDAQSCEPVIVWVGKE